MDPLRRGALMRVGRLVAGAAGAGMALSRGSQVEAKMVNPSPYPPLSSLTSPRDYAGETIKPDPTWSARRRAADELESKVYGEVSPRWRLTDNMHTENSSYLPALRSTAPWWRAHVMQEQAKKRQRALDTLQDQIKKLMESPMDKLKDMADEALGAFMEELNKP